MANSRPSRLKPGRVIRTGNEKNPLSYSPVPHALAEDPSLKPMDMCVVIQILKWLRDKTSGWVYNDVLARDLRCSVRTVQRSLRALHDAGWITLGTEPENTRARRSIVANWRQPGFAVPGCPDTDDTPTMTSVSPGAMTSVSSQGELLQEEPLKENDQSGSPREAPPGGLLSLREITLSGDEPERGRGAHEGDLEHLRGMLDRVAEPGLPPRSRSARVHGYGGWLATKLMDPQSKANYFRVLHQVARGELPAEMILEAFDQTISRATDGKVGVMGSYFFKAIEYMEGDRVLDEYEERNRARGHGTPPAGGKI